MGKGRPKQPIISVIMPVYNAERFLEEAIGSVLGQTFRNFEFIIIDDGSTDRSFQIIQKFMSKDDRISCISRENKGLICSLNEGINASVGAYLVRMDADDVCYPDRLEMQYDFMIEKRLDISGGDYISICEDGSFLKTHTVPKQQFEILLTMGSNVPFAHPSVIIRREFLVNHKLLYGAFGHRNAEDIDMWMNMYNAGAKFGNLATRILKYRQVSNSYSSVYYLPMKKEVATGYDLFVHNNYQKMKEALEQFCHQSNNTSTLEKAATRALLRHLTVKFNFTLLFKFLRKVSFYNLIFGFVSYINSRLMVNWRRR